MRRRASGAFARGAAALGWWRVAGTFQPRFDLVGEPLMLAELACGFGWQRAPQRQLAIQQYTGEVVADLSAQRIFRGAGGQQFFPLLALQRQPHLAHQSLATADGKV